jgi:hypothetical protein
VAIAVLLGLVYSYIFSFVVGVIVSSEAASIAVRAFNPFFVTAIAIATPLALLLMAVLVARRFAVPVSSVGVIVGFVCGVLLGFAIAGSELHLAMNCGSLLPVS